MGKLDVFFLHGFGDQLRSHSYTWSLLAACINCIGGFDFCRILHTYTTAEPGGAAGAVAPKCLRKFY